MPGLDVSFLLDDPEFATTILLTRNNAARNALGENTITSAASVSVVACVQPVNSNDLARLPDGARLSGAVTVWSREPMSPGGPGFVADTFQWPADQSGRTYTVRLVDDWTEFGGGFTRAVADMLDLQ